MNEWESKARLRARLEAVRSRTLKLLESVTDDFLKRRVHEFYSPIGWHFGHVGRTEEFWVMTEALGQPPLDPHLAFLLADRPDNPKDNRVTIPDRPGLIDYLAKTRHRVLEALESTDLASENPLVNGGYGWEFAIQHECQHQETIAEMLTLIAQQQSILEWPNPFEWQPAPGITGWAALPGGEFTMGSDDPYGYDNEKRAHPRIVAPFALARFPVTAYQWSEFIEAGGYRTPALWSSDGWAWRCENGVSLPEYWVSHEGHYFRYSPAGVQAIHPDEPASCLSWYEADAYARWSGHRLPTETEWEFAASITPGGDKLTYPHREENEGEDDPEASSRSAWTSGPRPLDPSRPSNAWDFFGLSGTVWAWTSDAFLPYPGFEAFPYDGYSKDHMLGHHRVCRGGSWATATPILRSTFRNWYVPTYRQGFLGMRLARND